MSSSSSSSSILLFPENSEPPAAVLLHLRRFHWGEECIRSYVICLPELLWPSDRALHTQYWTNQVPLTGAVPKWLEPFRKGRLLCEEEHPDFHNYPKSRRIHGTVVATKDIYALRFYWAFLARISSDLIGYYLILPRWQHTPSPGFYHRVRWTQWLARLTARAFEDNCQKWQFSGIHPLFAPSALEHSDFCHVDLDGMCMLGWAIGGEDCMVSMLVMSTDKGRSKDIGVKVKRLWLHYYSNE